MHHDPLQGPPYLLGPHNIDFPDANLALTEPDGLLAAGGDLRPDRLLNAYRHGIFPWFGDDQPILWWSPNPRTVLYPEQLYLSRSLRKTLRQGKFTVTFDQIFAEIIKQCAAPRRETNDTWITQEVQKAYLELHHRGYAHSVECWQDGELVGGLYGVAIGRVFFGESMFSRVSNASKVAFATLAQHLTTWQYQLIDCQVYTTHLSSLGAVEIPRQQFLEQLQQLCPQPPAEQAWR